MKRFFISMMAGVLLLMTVGVACAQDTVSVQLDGEAVRFDTAPRIIGDRVMLPVRAVFEAMGMTVDWDEATQTAIGVKGHRRIFLTLGSTTAWVNDLPYTLDVPPQTVDDRTLVPMRFVAESLGYVVNWYEPTQTVYIETPKSWIVQEPLELTFFSDGVQGVYDYNKMTVFQEADKKTNIKLTGKSIYKTDIEQEFSTLLIDSPLPDIIRASKKRINKSALTDMVIPLDELIDQYAPNIKRVLDEHPEYVAGSAASDGKLYFIPNLYEGRASMGFYIRKDWLDKLGLSVPTTVDELYGVLKAFREQDPNDNGRQDEVPYFYRDKNVDGLIQLWGAYNDWHVDENGRAVHGKTEEAYRDAMRALAKWYQEGLIDPEIYTRGSYSREQLLGDNVGGMTHDWLGSTAAINKYAYLIDGYQWVAIAPPADVNGVVKEIFQSDTLRPDGWAISCDNKHPVETIKFFDWWFSEEGQRAYNYGMEGVDYTMADGAPRYTEKVLNADGGVLMYMRDRGQLEIGAKMSLQAEIDAATPEAKEGLWLYNNSPEWYAEPFPPLSYTPEEQMILDKSTAMQTYIIEWQQMWLMGFKNIDATWDQYIADLKAMGYDEWRQVQQDAYDRYQAALRTIK